MDVARAPGALRATTLIALLLAAPALSPAPAGALPAVPNDPRLPELWQHSNRGPTATLPEAVADADQDTAEAWRKTLGSPRAVVAVVDSGIRPLPDLEENLWRNPGETVWGRESNGLDDDRNGYVDDVHGWSFFHDAPRAWPKSAHGSQVAAVIGARGGNWTGGVGVAWQVSLMSLQVVDFGFGTDGVRFTDSLVRAFAYAAANGARVVNASFVTDDDDPRLIRAVAALDDVLFVVAAGNAAGPDGRGADLDRFGRPVPWGPDLCERPLPNVICVASSGPDDRLSRFSNYGARSVDLAAPGEALPALGFASGTSFAAAQVSGTAALLLGRRPGAPVAWLRRRILSSVDRLPALAGKVVTGGRLNVDRALPARWESADGRGVSTAPLRLEPGLWQGAVRPVPTLSVR